MRLASLDWRAPTGRDRLKPMAGRPSALHASRLAPSFCVAYKPPARTPRREKRQCTEQPFPQPNTTDILHRSSKAAICRQLRASRLVRHVKAAGAEGVARLGPARTLAQARGRHTYVYLEPACRLAIRRPGIRQRAHRLAPRSWRFRPGNSASCCRATIPRARQIVGKSALTSAGASLVSAGERP